MGMIDLSTYKLLRNRLFLLFDYITSISSPFYGMHGFISTIRLFQLLGPSFCASFESIWGSHTKMSVTNDVLSVFYHIIPVSYQLECSIPFCIGFCVVFWIAFIILIFSSKYYSHEARLPDYVPPFISIFFGTVGYIIPPIAIQLVGKIVGKMITQPDKYRTVFNIVTVASVFLTLAIYVWVFITVYSISLTFKPDSLMSVIPSVQVFLCIITLTLTFFTSIASQLDYFYRVILLIVTAIGYCWFLININKGGGVIKMNHKKGLAATSSTGIILTSLFVFIEITGKIAGEYMLVAFIGLWITMYILSNIVLERRTTQSLVLLDSMDEENEKMDSITSESKFIIMAIDGMRVAHPICLSWRLFKHAVAKWPENVEVWFVFAKFAAIYPEETQLLEWISMGMGQNHLKGSLSKNTRHQIITIMRQREINLIPELKSKLDKQGKQIQATKHKVRYFWDLIIQGNIRDLESAVSRAYKSIEKTESDFQHLLRQFPNSRFVARAYARFLRDVVADHAGHKRWAQNVLLMQRGISVIRDQSRTFGVFAFPLLPKNTEAKTQAQPTPNLITDDTLTQDIDNDDDQAANDAELRMSVRDSINNLEIPSFTKAFYIRISILVLLFVIPCIALSFYVPYFISDISNPLSFMYKISQLRTAAFQIIGVSHHYVHEKLDEFDPLHLYGDSPPIGFGNSSESLVQMEFLLMELSSVIHNLSDIMSFHQGESNMDSVRMLLFRDHVNFTYFKDSTSEVYYEMISIQSAMMEITILVHEIMKNNITSDIFDKKHLFMLIANVNGLTNDLSQALYYIRHYIITADKATEDMLNIIMISMSCLVVVINISATVFIIVQLSKEKMMIYKCIASLPKNAVSRVADTFKVLKKEEDEELKTSHTHDEELNKQEENMLKIFATSSDTNGNNSASDNLMIVLSALFVAIVHIACTILLCEYMEIVGEELVSASPHIDYILASYSYDFASLVVLNMIASHYAGHEVRGYPMNTLLAVVKKWQDMGLSYYMASRFGDDSLEATPFTALADSTSIHVDSDCGSSTAPTTLHEVYRCWDPDLLTSFMQMEIRSVIQSLTHHENATLDGKDERLSHLWHIHQVHLYDHYYYPTFETIIPSVHVLMNQNRALVLGVAYILLFVALVLEFINLGSLSESEKHQKFALRLLLHCPGSIVLGNSHITTLLSGNFKGKNIDGTTRDSEFYDILVKEMPDSIITTDHSGIVLTVNKASSRIFGINSELIIGHHISEFGQKFKENPFNVFGDKPLTSSNDFESSQVFVKEDNTEINIDLSFNVLSDNIIVNMRDETQRAVFHKLIKDEKEKSDTMLAAILPPKLVTRVQQGEKNISFAVQSATIIFIDIVGFTPWCGSLPAHSVMSTLNTLFTEFDQILSNHSTMTKIKCIGDCYLAAGGLFADVNQPAVHAKDVVDFAFDAMDALEKVNQKINQKLKIRLGIHTGGPIVAGVLGTEKPTFEILGPTIVMAQQMEHHGIPMKIHISRSVYELIYGSNYDIKERGSVEIRNSSVITYLVEKSK